MFVDGGACTGVSEKTAAAKDEFFEEKISFEEWARIDASSWKGHDYIDIREMVRKATVLRTGAKELVSTLQKRGVVVAMVSGGLDVQCEYVAEELGVPKDLVITNVLGRKPSGDGGEVLDGTVDVRVTWDGKGDVIVALAKKLGIDMACVCHVGDDDNDLPAFRACGESVAVNPRTSRAGEGARHCVEKCSNLMDLAVMLMPPARVVWIRHGQAEHNVGKERGPFIMHPKLTSQGVASVLELRSELRKFGVIREGEDSRKSVSAVYCSPLERAIQTATLLFPKHCVILDDRLSEILGGNMASKRASADSIKAEWKEHVNIDAVDPKSIPWLGDFVLEPKTVFTRRLKLFLRELYASVRPGETVAVVTHSGVLYILLGLHVYTGKFVFSKIPTFPESDK